MKIILIVAAGIIILFLAYLIWQYFELKKFKVTEYVVLSDKVQEEQRLAVISDLHGYEYGNANSRLMEKIREMKPHFILIAGDLIVSKDTETYKTALKTLEQLVQIAPVYYGFGNHESRVNREGLVVSEDFAAYRKAVKELGVHILQNKNVLVRSEKDELSIGSVEIDLSYYQKKVDVPMEASYIGEIMGEAHQNYLQILLAHHPTYSEQYASWGADLTFCGHNHGGLVRIPGIGSIISPQLTLFPKYSDGLYEIDGKKVIVSRGLGTHTFHVRVFNRAELLCVRVSNGSSAYSSHQVK